MNTLVLLIFVPLLVGFLLALNPILSFTPLSTARPYAEKLTAYECGFTTIPGQTRSQLTIAFYIVAILFLIFDLEIALLVPIVPSLSSLGNQAYVSALIFISVLTFGFVLELASGAINWSKNS